MIRHSFFDYNYDYLRFDTTWKFEWDVDNETENTVKFYPFTRFVDDTSGETETWYFCGTDADHNANGETNLTGRGSTIVTSTVWNAAAPILEYRSNDEAEGDGTGPTARTALWNEENPENFTRYLSPFGANGLITLTNTIESVIIDTIPPQFVTDAGTEYILIKTSEDPKKVYRHIELVFRDNAGLDYKQFVIKAGDKVLYEYKRKPVDDGKPQIIDDLIKKNTLKVFSDGYNTYKIQFDLQYDEELEDILTSKGLTVEVWDKSANHHAYNFGTGDDSVSVNKKKWIYIDSKRALDEFEPLQISFSSVEPADMIIKDGKPGEAWCTIFNPNEALWALGMDSVVSQLSKESLGWIDITTLTDVFKDLEYNKDGTPTHYEQHGCIKFKIINVDKAGDMEVEAWVRTGIEKFDGILKTVTYAKAGLKWMCMDPDGRLYNLKPYVPKYMRGTDYANFIEFFELYLNTVYTNMTRGTNISVLEKIAEIADFLDIDKIEDYLVREYARHRGAEYDIDLMTMLNMNLGFFNPETFGSRTESDVLDIVKYALKNLPMYNQLKGTEKGMVLALRMFSFVCKLIPLWVRMSPQVEEYPNFYEEDRLYSFTGYFLTSRFNMEFDATNCDFKEFNDNLDSLIKFIKSIKPITKILNLIKYTIISEVPMDLLVNENAESESGTGESYQFVYRQDDIDDMVAHSRLDYSVMHPRRLWLGFRPSAMCTCGTGEFSNAYTTLSSMVDKWNGDMVFTYEASEKEVKYNFTAYRLCNISYKTSAEEAWKALKVEPAEGETFETFKTVFDEKVKELNKTVYTQPFFFYSAVDAIMQQLTNIAEIPADELSFRIYYKEGYFRVKRKTDVSGKVFDDTEDGRELTLLEKFTKLTGLVRNTNKIDKEYARINRLWQDFQQEYAVLDDTLRPSTTTTVKTFPMRSAVPHILDSGFYLEFTDGDTATYVSDIYKHMTAKQAGIEFVNKWAMISLGLPEVEVTGYDELAIKFTHIPGTEVYHFSE